MHVAGVCMLTLPGPWKMTQKTEHRSAGTFLCGHVNNGGTCHRHPRASFHLPRPLMFKTHMHKWGITQSCVKSPLPLVCPVASDPRTTGVVLAVPTRYARNKFTLRCPKLSEHTSSARHLSRGREEGYGSLQGQKAAFN